jgi:uncharacterized protein YecT (DUF1311 family)
MVTFRRLLPARRPRLCGVKKLAVAGTAAVTLGCGLVAGAAAASPTTAAVTVTFSPIREVFDGNRVARFRPAGTACHAAVTTLQLVTCNEYLTENVDVEINALRQHQFDTAPSHAARVAINADDGAWLKNRAVVCALSYPAEGGGTIGEILVSERETQVSLARLAALQGRPVATAHLVATDDPDPHATEYATTGRGTLIGAIDTQGDATGGAVIAWVVIGGYRGFTVRTASFVYVDGTFTDKGVVQDHPGGHHVAAGQEYVFDIDYSRLAQDPHRARGTGRYQYRSGGHVVGSWR